jgi:hypothetical protein
VTSLAGSPFGCELAWGTNGNSGNRASFLDFITAWIGSEPEQGLSGTCYGCDLVEALAGTEVIPVYYAYIIGEAGHDANLPDCNVGGPPNLCTGGADLIRQNRAQIIEKYAHYAQMTRDADPNKAVVWLLEGDFIQYYEPSQSSPLSLAELGDLARDITCAIKSNQPKAIVAMNHTTWNGDDETEAFWGAMPLEILDLVWTTGVGDHDGFFNADTNAESYNGTSARYSFVSELTGKKIFVDTSFGPSEQDDSWSTANQSDLNGRIGEGVVAVNVTDPPGDDSDYQSRIAALRPNLGDTCQ